jgi:hypothetical protein
MTAPSTVTSEVDRVKGEEAAEVDPDALAC